MLSVKIVRDNLYSIFYTVHCEPQYIENIANNIGLDFPLQYLLQYFQFTITTY